MSSQEVDPREFLFDFVLYLVTCARLHLDEKPIYGAFRMIEGASRLIEAAENLPGWEVDAFLAEQRAAIEANKARMTVDKDGFRGWLKATAEERKTAATIKKAQASKQFDLFDLFQDIEQTEEDFLKRDLRHALKARALKAKLPIQIVTRNLLEDSVRGQDSATRAWNFSVGVYYKSGGVPWRLPQTGPETCFVGVSFHHFRTTKRHIIQASLAQAFSSEGEGFAIRGEGVPAEPDQNRNVHLSEEQAYNLAESIVTEYATRTGGAPVRVVMHKTTYFDDAELVGFRAALSDTPIVDLVTLVPSSLRLLRLGTYPPKVGTLCTINSSKSFLFTSGYMPELGTYPGPHVPQPFEVRLQLGGSKAEAAQDVLNLTRMNWNTADIRGKWPVTLSFARRVGGILDEFGDADPHETSFRYFV